MPLNIKTLWREPLLHFLLLGFALFLYYDLAGDDVEAPPKRVHVDRGAVQQLAANFQRTWSRPPTAAELDAMVEGYVREEIFYREALAMGLDQDDPLVRRRLRMKLEFMLEDLSAQNVDDAVLATYLQQNADTFRVEPQVSFVQVYLDPDRRADLEADAAQLLASLSDGADPELSGDPTLAPRAYPLTPQSVIARDFGDGFAQTVSNLPPGDWSGPHYSPFGAHLVKVEQQVEARMPALAEVRDTVLREYRAEQSRIQKDIAYQKLRETYEVTVESPAEPASSDASVVSEANGETTQ
ncbi:MAG: peptidylprolyl isomerase [Gammaproteobacteria bacterium]|nr:peptidylprolyl isomerase [Gammaproteobacteria bacterium]